MFKGLLSDKIKIYKAVENKNSIGEVERELVLKKIVIGKVVFRRFKYYVENYGINEVEGFRLYLPPDVQVDLTDLIEWNGDLFEIRGINYLYDTYGRKVLALLQIQHKIDKS